LRRIAQKAPQLSGGLSCVGERFDCARHFIDWHLQNDARPTGLFDQLCARVGRSREQCRFDADQQCQCVRRQWRALICGSDLHQRFGELGRDTDYALCERAVVRNIACAPQGESAHRFESCSQRGFVSGCDGGTQLQHARVVNSARV
jgi:hypothetical protein